MSHLLDKERERPDSERYSWSIMIDDDTFGDYIVLATTNFNIVALYDLFTSPEPTKRNKWIKYSSLLLIEI